MSTVLYEVTGPVARLTLNRPERGNGINRTLLGELVHHVEEADLDPRVRVLLLSGAGKGFCGGYDLVESAEGRPARRPAPGVEAHPAAPGLEAHPAAPGVEAHPAAPGVEAHPAAPGLEAHPAAPGVEAPSGPAGSPLDPTVVRANHDPTSTWDPLVDYAMMSRNVRAFMTLFHCSKPVVTKVHGFCVAGGTDMALCSDLLVIAADARFGYPPARVWGSPTTALWAHRLGPQRAKRLLFTGDCITGAEALEWGLATEAPPAAQLDERADALAARIARLPLNQLQMMKLLVNQSLYSQGLHATQMLGTLFDGIARHTAEGYAFQRLAASEGFKAAVRDRDEPFGDAPARPSGSPQPARTGTP